MSDFSLESLKNLSERCEQMLKYRVPYLREYFVEQDGQAFFSANKDLVKKKKISMTNTCYSVLALLDHPGELDSMSQEESAGSICPKVVTALVENKWTSEGLEEFNMYTTPFVLATLRELESKGILERVSKGLNALFENMKDNMGVAFPKYAPSGYLTYWGCRALENECLFISSKTQLKRKCKAALSDARDWAESEIHRQLAFHLANDWAEFDPFQLAHCLAVFVKCRRHKQAASGNLNLQNSLSPLGINEKVIKSALRLVFESQKPDGIWQKTLPICHTETRGSIYTFSCEMLGILMRPGGLPNRYFRPYIEQLERTLSWVEDNFLEVGKLKGWRSNEVTSGAGPEAWSTAAVFQTLEAIREVVIDDMNDQVKKEFHALEFDRPEKSSLDPKNFYDSEVAKSEDGKSLRTILMNQIVNPHETPSGADKRVYSAVLFGPPGTGKTSVGKAIASALGWPYIYLNTSDFAVYGGIDTVIRRAREIFEKLGYLKNVVVLFDEVEEFVSNRKDPKMDANSRLVTTSMLSLIQELRSKENVIFIVTTNLLGKFDGAIKRSGGRFDKLILVAPPSRDEKIRLFGDKLEQKRNMGNEIKEVETLKGTMKKVVDKKYDTWVKYFSFTEWASFCDEVIELAEKGGASDANIKRLLAKAAINTTILGDNDIRKSFDRSHKLVRL